MAAVAEPMGARDSSRLGARVACSEDLTNRKYGIKLSLWLDLT